MAKRRDYTEVDPVELSDDDSERFEQMIEQAESDLTDRKAASAAPPKSKPDPIQALASIFCASMAEADARRLELQGADAEDVAVRRDVALMLLGDPEATRRSVERLNRWSAQAKPPAPETKSAPDAAAAAAKGCNRHKDCRAAAAEWLAKHGEIMPFNQCCDDDCEDCFGS